MTYTKRNILMVYPKFPSTYWGMQYALPLMGKKGLMPPLGLITIAALSPPHYQLRLVDLNCEPLQDQDLAWADMVCLSAMLPQKHSLFETAKVCKAAGKLVVFGGPYPTACPEECATHADVLVLDEGEITWNEFLRDFESGAYKSRYTTKDRPDVTQTPVPRFDLLRIGDYTTIPVQFSRGCPYLCEFCDITVLFGRRPRTKTPDQMLKELDAIYVTGHRGPVFIVDDNFIGNKKEAAKFLIQLVAWNRKHGTPFFYGTEASVNLGDEPELLKQMALANFTQVFLGIETPEIESLKETRKLQNLKGSLLAKVETIQRAGLQVYGGFIVGFDHDPEDIFERQIAFIHQAAIPQAMIGPLVALPGTPLYARMERTGRLLSEFAGDQERTVASGYSNIATKIPVKQLMEGQRRILEAIYKPTAYFARSLEVLSRLPQPKGFRARLKRFLWLNLMMIKTFAGQLLRQKSAYQQLVTQYRAFKQVPFNYYRAWLILAWNMLRKCPDQLPWLMECFFVGYHFYRFTFDYAVPGLTDLIAQKESAERQIDERHHSAA
jgi:radical SAM superfamily enzyme YgiQ (UPF0313 family)